MPGANEDHKAILSHDHMFVGLCVSTATYLQSGT